jgi:hypothetical protein
MDLSESKRWARCPFCRRVVPVNRSNGKLRKHTVTSLSLAKGGAVCPKSGMVVPRAAE